MNDKPQENALLFQQLCELQSDEEQKHLLETLSIRQLDSFAHQLKDRIGQLLWQTDGIPKAQKLTYLLHFLCELTEDDLHLGLALRAQGNVYLYSSKLQDALNCYEQAVQVYEQYGDELEIAKAQVGTVAALCQMGRFVEAEAVYQTISDIFLRYEHWQQLASVAGNLATSYHYQGKEIESLRVANQAKELFKKLGPSGESSIPGIENNRAISLRNLGRFEESIEASGVAWNIHMKLGQDAEAAHALHTTAFTYFLLGHYNKALQCFEQARDMLLQEDNTRKRSALVIDTDMADCLLQLRRFDTVLEKCGYVQKYMSNIGLSVTYAKSYINQALAYANKYPAEYEKALESIAQAQEIFGQDNNVVWIAITNLNKAAILYLKKDYKESILVIQACVIIFQGEKQPVHEANAWLVAARSALQLKSFSQAHQFAQNAFCILQHQEEQSLPYLAYQVYSLFGTLARSEQKYEQAYQEYALAVQNLALLRGRIMVEFTAGFLEDKQTVYEEIVHLCIHDLDIGYLSSAWNYAEQAKSRALLDLLAHRIDLKIQAKRAEDRPLLQELAHLRAERSRLYRSWQEKRLTKNSNGRITSSTDDTQQIQKEILSLERIIETKWNTLQSHNGDYERDATLSSVPLKKVQAYLASDSCIIEYFLAKEELFVFIITACSLSVHSLGYLSNVRPLLLSLQMNLKATSKATYRHIQNLAYSAQGTLNNLFTTLVRPILEHVKRYHRWIIVPHGLLHSLPFHALHDGQFYLLEKYEVSYLPSASLLPYTQQRRSQGKGSLIMAHTQGGSLPGRASEGQAVATYLQEVLYLDQEATLEQIHTHGPHAQILHLATHGQFNADNPLFSGLAFEDGELTTFDIFNLQLSASLVVLSACETARAKLGGGDELFGLSRAFFYAGAKSLLVSHWKVEDESTAQLMELFYTALIQGQPKGKALQRAQQLFLARNRDTIFAHPFFWSAFFLMGDAGAL